MGLDMYLEAELFIGGQYEHREVAGTVDISMPKGKHYVFDATEIGSLTLPIGYWRKANAVHAWFVEHVQDGEDNCQRSHVSREQLLELKESVQEALDAPDDAAGILPPRSGFFFGSTDTDEWYFEDLKNTVKILDKALALPDDYDFYYQASW